MSRMEKTLGRIGNGLKSFAKNAGARFALLTLHASEPAIGVVSVRQIDASKGSPLVFDLTVERQHCYLANGLLVSNSNGADAFQQLAVGLKRGEMHMENSSVFGNVDVFSEDDPVVEPWQSDGVVF